MLELLGRAGMGSFGQAMSDAAPVLVAIVAALSAFILISRIFAGPSVKREGPNVFARMTAALAKALSSNWQLTLLALTAFVLSLASGWTTWDGMRNFTGEPVLSLMVTFGIQGVMLIIAWLIGESFATGTGRSGERFQVEKYVAIPAGILCFVGIANALGLVEAVNNSQTMNAALSAFANWALLLGVGLLVFSAIFLNQQSTILQPYLHSVQVMARNAVLWVMFLACMATSVFFSFDSLFSAIFPKEERQRAGEIRAVRQIAGIVNDIGGLATRRQAEEAEQLFRNSGWVAYERNLATLSQASQGAEQAIERYFVERMEAHRTAMATQQERIATAKSGQAGLASSKGILTDELSRLKSERPPLAADLAEKKTELDSRSRNIDAKRVEAMAEERGAEGTLKAGKGPIFRERMSELAQQQDAVKIQEQRVRDATKRMADADARIAQIGRELASVDADLAKLQGEAETAAQRIAVAEQAKTGDESGTPKVDPARVRTAFERALTDFRQQPTTDRLGMLTAQCSQLLGAMLSTPATKDRVRNIDCDPKQANEAAARVFALNAGLVTFARHCTGGDKLPEAGGTDALLTFGRKCLQDSGLPSKDSAEMAAKISSIDLNRDDKAHRFVVTWNAFTDGNRLAYLALAIAIAIDSLVFMSGLFGANAVRSPLTEIEDRGEMTADQLEAIVDSALHDTGHPRATLQAIMAALHPINGDRGFTSEIILDARDDEIAREVRQVLNQAATIGAVRNVSQDRTRYHLHYGLVRYLGLALKKAPRLSQSHVDRKELVNVVGVALLPVPQHNAEQVLSEMHPVSDSEGFAAETYPFRIAEEDKRRLVLNALGAGATVPGTVKRENDNGRYFVSTDFYKTLLLMRAGAIPAFRDDVVGVRFGGRAPLDGGPLLPAVPKVFAAPVEAVRIEDRSARQPQPADVSEDVPPQTRAPEVSAPRRAPSSASVPLISPATRQSPAPPLPSQHSYSPLSDQPAPPPRNPPRSEAVRVAISAVDEAGPIPDPSLSEAIRSDVIQLGGLHNWNEREIRICRAIGSESEPELALRRLTSRAPRLAQLVRETIDQNRASLRDAYENLLAHHGQDSMYTQVLETVVVEMDDLMPLLMLTPGGPYQQLLEHVLIGQLERQAGEGVLGETDQLLLARARAQVDAFRRLADNLPDRYSRIVRIIDHYDEREIGHPGVVDARGADTPNRPLT